MRHHGIYRYGRSITWVRVDRVYAFAVRHGWPAWFTSAIARGKDDA